MSFRSTNRRILLPLWLSFEVAPSVFCYEGEDSKIVAEPVWVGVRWALLSLSLPETPGLTALSPAIVGFRLVCYDSSIYRYYRTEDVCQ